MSQPPEAGSSYRSASSTPVEPPARLKSVLSLFALVAVAFLVYWGVTKNMRQWVAGDTQSMAALAQGVGMQMPAFELSPLTGESQKVTSQALSGKIVLLNFWGTWCPPCREELPHIVALEKEYRGQGQVAVLSVSCSGNDKENLPDLKQETQAYLVKRKLEFPTYADPQYAVRDGLKTVAVFDGYPTTVLIDQKGKIRAIWAGYDRGTELEMKQLIEQLLSAG